MSSCLIDCWEELALMIRAPSSHLTKGRLRADSSVEVHSPSTACVPRVDRAASLIHRQSLRLDSHIYCISVRRCVARQTTTAAVAVRPPKDEQLRVVLWGEGGMYNINQALTSVCGSPLRTEINTYMSHV